MKIRPLRPSQSAGRVPLPLRSRRELEGFRPDQEGAGDPAPKRRPAAAGADQASETLRPARIHAGIHSTITLFEKGKA